MGNSNSRFQPGPAPGYAQNLLYQQPGEYGAQDGGLFGLGRRKSARDGYGGYAGYPQATMPRPIYSNGYVAQYPQVMGAYPQAIYPQMQAQAMQGMQYYVPQQPMVMPQMQPQVVMPQMQAQMQPGMQMPQPQVQMQQAQQQQQQPVIIPQMIPQQQTQQMPQQQQPGAFPQPHYPNGYTAAPENSNPNPNADRQNSPMPTPLPPAPADAFGPPGPRPLTPIANPLPSPPKDVYELEPYKSMLSRDLTGTWTPPPRAPGPEFSGTSDESGSEGRPRRKKKKKGFFGSLRRKDKDKRGGLFRGWTGRERADEGMPSMAALMDGPIPPVIPAPTPGPSNAMPMPQMFTPNGQAQLSPNPNGGSSGTPSPAQPIRFNIHTELAGFLPHSEHRVLFNGALYPSAFHLFEALKFLKNGREDVAERIRTCENPAEVHPLSESLKEFARQGFERELVGYMEEALYAKFTQHPELRELLLSTGVADLIYAEASDPVWGEGPLGQGMNHLGRALMALRERLRQEMGAAS